MTSTTKNPDDFPDDERRRAVLEAMLAEATFDGWTPETLDKAAREAGFTAPEVARGDVKTLFPKGIRDVLDFWAMEEDRALTQAWTGLNAKPARIRDKITWLVRQRIAQLAPNREAARRAAATLALPLYAGEALRHAWRTAGIMWEALGDTSTDGNWYTKRLTLSTVYLATLTRWFADEGAEEGETWVATWDFLDDRIGNVMQFEKTKAQWQKRAPDPVAIAGWFGRLRYGASSKS